jgi:hypothetical protein
VAHQSGAKLGTRISVLVSKAIVSTHSAMLGMKHQLAMAVFHSISDTISAEVHQVMDPIFSTLLNSEHGTGIAHEAIKFMLEETGQLEALAGAQVLSGGILSSIGQIVNNELAPAVQGWLGSNPHGIPDSGTTAALAAKGIIDTSDAEENIAKAGLNYSWAANLIEANVDYSDTGTALQLLQRGIISYESFVFICQRNGVPPGTAQDISALANTPLSPADAALAFLRNTMSQADAEAAAALSGVDPATFNVMVENTGEPLGLEQLLEAYRRDFIDQATLEEGILQSRVRDQWIPTAIQLAYSPMSVADAVNAVNQNQLDQATAEIYAQQNGLMAGQLQILLNTAGEPLSRTEMEQLYNRGLVTEAQVTQALDESRLKPKYTQLAFELHTRLLTPGELSDAVLYGAMDENTAVGKAMEQGYAEDDAAILVLAASNAKMLSYRARIVSDIAELYEVNAMDETTASGLIESVGWSSAEANVILQAAEYNREKRLQAAAITSIRSKYIGYHIDQATMQTDLGTIGVPAGEIAYLSQLWTLEQSANIPHMSAYDVAKAVSAGLMQLSDAVTYLQSFGYSASDANILAQVAG